MKKLAQKAQGVMIMPLSAYLASMDIQPGTKLTLRPHSTNRLSNVTWWRIQREYIKLKIGKLTIDILDYFLLG
jgi:hypothetical protein